MTILFDELLACDACANAIANGDYEGYDAGEEAATKRGIRDWSREGDLVLGDEYGFSWRGCDCCDNGLGGNKHYFAVLGLEVRR
jgi:hypothetical protein